MNLYAETYKVLMKETKDRNREIKYAHQLENSTLVKISMPLKLIYSFNTIPIKIPAKMFIDIVKVIIKSI